jgi:hypothetical protein
MHIVERLALSAGIKIGKPFIYPKFFPLAVDKYITLHTTSKQSKTYDYWPEVIELIQPLLLKEGISIVQVGAKDDKAIEGCYITCGQTKITQTAYILKDSLLHLGVDSFPTHIVSGMWPEKKIVCLYSNNFPGCVGPYWTKPENKVILEPEREEGEKPSLQLEEHPKTINTIKPEVIAKAVCDSLGIEFPFTHETIFIGPKIREKHFELIPTGYIDADQDLSLVVRMDRHFDEKNLEEQIKRIPCYIITDKPISKEFLKTYKDRIRVIQYIVKKDYSLKFIEQVIKSSIPHALISFLPEEEVNKIKGDLMDYGVIDIRTPDRRGITDMSNLKYRSAKTILFNNTKYYSNQDVTGGNPIKEEKEFKDVTDTDDFWLESEYYHIIRENK